MSYYVSTYETLDRMSRPTVAAGLFAAGKPFAEDTEILSNDKAIMVAYGSHTEAALLAMRAALVTAVGAVEMEISYRRKTRVAVTPPVASYTREADDAEDAEWEEGDTDPGDDSPVVELDDDDDPATVVVVVSGEDPDEDN